MSLATRTQGYQAAPRLVWVEWEKLAGGEKKRKGEAQNRLAFSNEGDTSYFY